MKKITSYHCDNEGCTKVISDKAVGIQYTEAGAVSRVVSPRSFDSMADLCCSWTCQGEFLQTKIGMEVKNGKDKGEADTIKAV